MYFGWAWPNSKKENMLQKIAKTHLNGTFMLCKLDHVNKICIPVGTAFICHHNGYLLSCAHTIQLTDSLALAGLDELNGFNGFKPLTLKEPKFMAVSIAQYDSINDVALLKFSSDVQITVPQNVPQNIFAGDMEVELGSTCGYIGFPFSDIGMHTRHIAAATLSSRVLTDAGARQYQLDATIHEGCSGGPLIDASTNKIMGIICGRFSPAGPNPGARIGNRGIGTDSSIGYATAISHGIALMKEVGLNV